MAQILEIVGALLILSAFAGAQAGRLTPRALAYLLPNLFGSALLAVLAAMDGDLGFLLLEGVWAVVTLWGLVQVARRPGEAAA